MNKNPKYKSSAFYCPICKVFAKQDWFLYVEGLNIIENEFKMQKTSSDFLNNLSVSICSHCKNYALWVDKKMVYPKDSIAPLPNEDMPDDVKSDFMEARKIVSESPRGACALLRLALQKLMRTLGEDGKNLNHDIGNLVKKGLDKKIQEALDSIRVIGNEAVHPGELNLKDDEETALALFKIMNFIIETQISAKKQITNIYDSLPEDKKQGINNRDNI